MSAYRLGASLNQWSVSSFLFVVSFSHLRSKTRSHLEYLHLQVLSVVTVTQLRRIFERRTNFDLGRLLGGTLSRSFLLRGSFLERVGNSHPFAAG